MDRTRCVFLVFTAAVALAATPARAGHAVTVPHHLAVPHAPAGHAPAPLVPDGSGGFGDATVHAAAGALAGWGHADDGAAAVHGGDDALSFEAAIARQPAPTVAAPQAPAAAHDPPAPGQALLVLALLALAAGLLRRTAPFNAGAASRSSG